MLKLFKSTTMRKIILLNRDNNQRIKGIIIKQYTDFLGVQVTNIKADTENTINKSINLYGTCEVGTYFSNLLVLSIEEEAKQPIIGKMYQVNDNSYGINITTATHYKPQDIEANLANCLVRPGPSAIGKIVSEPFLAKVWGYNQIIERTMIVIEFESKTYAVLYNEDWVI